MANINGTINDDPTLVGSTNSDTIDFSQGGADIVSAGDSDDILFGGAAFAASDRVDGGANYDKLYLDGNYSGGVTFGANTLVNVEYIYAAAGNNYALASHDNTVAAGAVLQIDGAGMSAGKYLIFNGSTETDGSFDFHDGKSNDSFIGGAQSDHFILSYGGNDTAQGGGGGDIFNVQETLNTNDRIDGGEGSDVMHMQGSYSTLLTFGSSFVKNVESISLFGDFVYNLAADDSFLAAGRTVYVSGLGISGAGSMSFNGFAETDGRFNFRDSLNDDTIAGGQSKDNFYTDNGGTDVLYGFGGDDDYAMGAALDASDWINGGDGKDHVNLSGDYSAGLIFNNDTMKDIEQLSFAGGYDYSIVLAEGNVAAGETLQVYGTYLGNGDILFVDGSAETDGRFEFHDSVGHDTFFGGENDDYADLDFGGLDFIYAGGGDDEVQFGGAFTTTGDFVDGGDGYDSVSLANSYAGGLTLGSNSLKNVESITLGGAFDYDVTTQDSLVAAGTSLSIDSFALPAGNSLVFDGSAETDGVFVLAGGDGDDTLIGGAQGDVFWVTQAGDDTLVGNGGADRFVGGYLVFNADDHVDGGAGTDTLWLIGASLTFEAETLQNVEKLLLEQSNDYVLAMNDANVAAGQVLTVDAQSLDAGDTVNFDGSAETNGSFNLISGAAADTLKGGAGSDTFNGGAGADTMHGGNGNDSYIVDRGGDQIVEAAGGGIDSVQSSVSTTLAAQVENLTLTGNAGTDGTGNAQVNTIIGNAGINKLDGGIGADTLQGGLGNDTYVVDSGGDQVVEAAGAGTGVDTVQSSVSHTLAANVEKLTLTGNAGTNGTGNNLVNTITGNSSQNVIDGGIGGDIMLGGNGSDTYIVDSGSDVITELAGEGIDTVQSSVTYTLAAQVEKLTLTGNAGTDATGNSLANTITGNSSQNVIDGGINADAMIGGDGNETYVVDSGGDVIVEAAGEGVDTVQSSVTHTLAANVEKLTLTGNAGTDATGNALANTIIGNSGINHIDGGALNDILTGGGGADDFVFGDGDGIDTVTDFQNGADQFDLTGVAGVDEFSDLVLTDLGASVKVDYGTGSFELATIADVATIDAGDFIFA